MLCRDGVYYFVRRIPVDMQHHYDKCRLYFSLRTQSKARAVRAAQSITQRLDDYWMGVRLQKLDIPKLSVIPDWSFNFLNLGYPKLVYFQWPYHIRIGVKLV